MVVVIDEKDTEPLQALHPSSNRDIKEHRGLRPVFGPAKGRKGVRMEWTGEGREGAPEIQTADRLPGFLQVKGLAGYSPLWLATTSM